MLSIAGILAIVVIIVIIDVPSMWRNKLVKELWVFSFILLFTTLLGIAQVLHFKTPNPLDWMVAVYKPLADAVDVWLK